METRHPAGGNTATRGTRRRTGSTASAWIGPTCSGNDGRARCRVDATGRTGLPPLALGVSDNLSETSFTHSALIPPSGRPRPIFGPTWAENTSPHHHSPASRAACLASSEMLAILTARRTSVRSMPSSRDAAEMPPSGRPSFWASCPETPFSSVSRTHSAMWSARSCTVSSARCRFSAEGLKPARDPIMLWGCQDVLTAS